MLHFSILLSLCFLMEKRQIVPNCVLQKFILYQVDGVHFCVKTWNYFFNPLFLIFFSRLDRLPRRQVLFFLSTGQPRLFRLPQPPLHGLVGTYCILPLRPLALRGHPRSWDPSERLEAAMSRRTLQERQPLGEGRLIRRLQRSTQGDCRHSLHQRMQRQRNLRQG